MVKMQIPKTILFWIVGIVFVLMEPTLFAEYMKEEMI